MNNNLLIGIDFGTTNTVITHFSNNKSNVVLDGIFKTIPSKIGRYNNMFYCGNYIPINCDNIIHSFKLSIGTSVIHKFPGDNTSYTQTDLLLVFFNHLYEIINKNIANNKNIKAVITVPSNFNDNQREIIKGCFESLDINVIRIINEPSAAALAYGLLHSSSDTEHILVIDTGGGTMDFTLLEKNETLFEVKHSEGLNNLGGNNFTNLIVDDMMNHLDQPNKLVVWNQAQKIKEKLTYLDSYEVKINSIKYNLSRNKFNNMATKLMKEVIDVLTTIVTNYTNINYIILVGGTSRIPLLQETITNIIKKKPWIHPNLESVVAEGAGLYIGIIENEYKLIDDIIIMDVLPLSLGIELIDGTYSIIIPKNTPLPVKRSQKYTTDQPGDSSILIKVYQGERKIANKNCLIGEFLFDKVSLGGIPIIEIAFKVDLNGMINIIIVDRKSGIEKNIMIKDLPKITNEEIDMLIDMSIKLADIDESELIRTQNIYIINNYITNIMINLQNNILLKNNNEILDKIKTIEMELETMDRFELIETINYFQNNFSILGMQTLEADSIDTMSDIEKILLNERKNELINRITLILLKNPSWEEYLQPVLTELSYNTVTLEYIDEKLKDIITLEQDDNIDNKNYKQQVNSLCQFIKMELENGNINLNQTNNNILIELVNKMLEKITLDDEGCDWMEELTLLNKKCEEIYNLTN